MKTHEKILNIIIFISFTILVFLSGYKYAEIQKNKTLTQFSKNIFNSSKKQIKDKSEIDFKTFWEAWKKLEENYIDKDKLDPQQMYYGAIKGMVASLNDPYTFYLTPEENKESKQDLEGKFEGIGAQLGLKEGKIVIIAPLENSPAEKAGLKAGDIILKVDNKSTEGWTLSKAVKNIRGERGTPVVLTVLRDGKEINITIIRDQINIPSIESEILEAKNFIPEKNGKFAYIRLYQFIANTDQDWDKEVQQILPKLKNKEIKGVILDLRNNPGGFLLSSVYIAEEFLKEDDLIVKQEFVDQPTKEFKSTRNGRLQNVPLIILINQGSASASEILAGSLQQHKKAILIGEKTFGKGSVQKVIDLSDGSGMHITVSKWILPNGQWINGKGIMPDIEVKLNIDENNTLTKENDNQLKRAVEELFRN